MSRIYAGMMRIDGMSKEEVLTFVKGCLSLGIDHFDLADIYGGGKCESLLGEALEIEPELRNKIYIQTKVGISNKTCGYDSSYDYIIKATKECLERLRCNYIDRLLIHRPDIFMESEEVAGAIQYLMEKGLVKSFGVSNFTVSEIEYLKTSLKTKIECNQVQLGLGNTDMIDQTMYQNLPSKNASKESDGLFFYMKKENIAIQCWSPFQYGFFEGSIFDKEKYPKMNEVLEKYAKKYDTSKCAIATQFLLKLDKNLIVVSGSTSLSHIKEMIDGESIAISKEDWYKIYKETGHLLP